LTGRAQHARSLAGCWLGLHNIPGLHLHAPSSGIRRSGAESWCAFRVTGFSDEGVGIAYESNH
jgi:hypothetical protein